MTHPELPITMEEQVSGISQEDIAEHTRRLEMVETRFSALPGQPSIIYWDSSNDTVVSICPVPQVGLVTVMLDHLNFVVIAHRAQRPGVEFVPFSKDEAAKYIEQAANKIDFGALVESDEITSAQYHLALDAKGYADSHGIGYKAIICVPVSAEILSMNLGIAIAQGDAAKRIQESLHTQRTDKEHLQ